MGGDLSNMVVLVDDEPNIRETVAFILEAEGVEVETGSDGVEGLEAVRRSKPKVVLLDVMMPRMDGYEVCEAIRNDPELAGVFVMILTAGACLAVNTALGFAIGWAMAALLIWGVFKIEKPPNAEDGNAD